jgi:hypothetical protein
MLTYEHAMGIQAVLEQTCGQECSDIAYMCKHRVDPSKEDMYLDISYLNHRTTGLYGNTTNTTTTTTTHGGKFEENSAHKSFDIIEAFRSVFAPEEVLIHIPVCLYIYVYMYMYICIYVYV